jgi:hypothetical protein
MMFLTIYRKIFMNKQRLFFIVFFSVCFIKATSEPIKKSPLLDFFVSTSKTHFIDPSWVLPVFLKMDIKEFDASWNILVSIIKDKPWYLVCSNYSHYVERKQRDTLIAHCKAYHTFLQYLFVNPKDDSMVFVQGNPPSQFISIYDYWKRTSNQNVSHFYAFYFDRVGATYIEAVNNAFLNMDHADYYKHLKEAYTLFVVLNDLQSNLMNSSYEARYSAHFKQYYEVLRLLLEEKKKQDAS